MFKFTFAAPLLRLLCLLSWSILVVGADTQTEYQPGAKPVYTPRVAAASNEGEMALKKFAAPTGFKTELFAAEPDLANVVAFTFDEVGRCYVCETFRHFAGVIDIRGIMDWLDEELASRSADERLAEMKRHLGAQLKDYTLQSERIRLIEDRDGDGKVDHSTVFAEGFNSILDGIGAGVLARKGSVWFANIPNLWLLQDTNHDGVADVRKSLHYGYGVRVGFLGHDLHGLRMGPDGKIYYSIGDRGSNIRVTEGKTVGETESGCVFRCNPDGSDLEVFSFGLRNPQDLAFDDHGNLFTGDNNSDSGDKARWVYVVEGADNGWRVGYQFMERPYSRGPFNAEKLWYPQFDGQAAYIVPPIANIADGPSGTSFFPGTGLPERYQGHFFLSDFRGSSANSGVHTFTMSPKGATFELSNHEQFIWHVLATDCQFGVAGGLYVSDWVEGWDKPGKGRIYRTFDPANVATPEVLETKRLLAEGMEHHTAEELAGLLGHADMRVRQEAQFALAERGDWKTLAGAAAHSDHPLARLHAIWGLGQVANFRFPDGHPLNPAALEPVVALLGDGDAEVRAQAAKVCGEGHAAKAFDGLVRQLKDESARVRSFAAISLGKLGRDAAAPALITMLRENADKDPVVRHAGVMGLVGINDLDAVLAAAHDSSAAVRMGALLAMRRLQRYEISQFLNDADPALVLEAARAINDVPINGAMAELAALIDRPTDSEPLLRRVLNANLHHGTAAAAAGLARFAARGDAPEKMRAEALDILADWPKPSGRDRVVGLWRPIAEKRDNKWPGDALRPVLTGLLRDAPERVRISATHAVVSLSIADANPTLEELVRNRELSGSVRAEALKALGAEKAPNLTEVIKFAQTDANETVRREAVRLEAETQPSGASASLLAALDHGSLAEQQNALATLGTIKDASADRTLGAWLDKLLAGSVAKELQLDVLDAAAKRTTADVRAKLAQYVATKPKDDALADAREELYGGDAALGKKVFFERPEASCVRCHKINGEGGDVGPNLTGIGSRQPREYLLESIVLPNKQIAAGFESWLVTMKDGSAHAGILKSENDQEVVLNSPEDGLLKLKKADITARQKGLSPMPEGLATVIGKRDLRNLVEFLSSLK